MTDPPPRKRSRAACFSCQSRKRKCSGEQPCSTCAQAGVVCVFSDLPRKRRTRSGVGYRTSLPGQNSAHERLVLSSDLDGGISSAAPVARPASSSVAGSAPSPGSHLRVKEPRPGSDSLEANSGAAFVRKLGLRIDPARAPRLHLFAWNVGERRKSQRHASTQTDGRRLPGSVVQILSEQEMRRLAGIYFEKVHPCYAFLDQGTVSARISQRWSSTTASIERPASMTRDPPYDVVLLGIAALGFLFSCRELSPQEAFVVDTARRLLERSILGPDSPTIDIVTGWVLRTAYLRMTASPHAAWMASCTLMHLVEAAGLHIESESADPEATGLIQTTSSQMNNNNNNNNKLLNQPSSPVINRSSSHSSTASPTSDANLRRRIYGMARHLNTWISFDLGRSRVVLHGASSHPPLPPPLPSSTTTPTNTDLYHLLPLSESLDPTGPTPQNLPELETALTAVLTLSYTEPSLILVQCNLMLCIYRRVRALNAHAPLPGRALDRILELGARGLRAARAMVTATCPWHQVANVPFQVLCILLAIDSRAALGLLAEAMLTLREVLTAYDTEVMREAYSTAYLLIALHQRRKEDDTRALGEVLRANAAAAAGTGTETEAETEAAVGGKEGAPVDTNGLAADLGMNVNANANADVSDISARAEVGGNISAQGEATGKARAQDVLGPVSDAELSWLGDLMIDMPSLQNFDLDQFLLTDVPWPLPEMGI
ncbi:hypothetical protein N7539_000540 [Penicillium diatomitis]|uniref:Zn(2)-C6 fungal-type domain-containing protein n=1 Tax=Penicillium diatomitis TaxID=2819901 RepID=A0A9W9XND2_9EURO|nr:uncharacterized protein N7539_000540 [Penicillium diatomitis]KAJ5495424.1 hypothetical protein N7539_000540 [Penicillium diatomitis]